MTAEDEKVIPIIINLHVKRMALFLKVAGATVSEGKYEGTSLDTNVGSPSPILNLKRDGNHVATAWVSTQDLIAAMIDGAEKAEGDLE